MARTPYTIAHDYRGVITMMRGSADLARGKLEPNHPALIDIVRIIRACEEAAALTMELRAMSRANGDAPPD